MEGKAAATLPFISDVASLLGFISLGEESRRDIESVSRTYPFRLTPFYARLMEADNPFCPIRLQAVPTAKEIDDSGIIDPLGEKEIAVTPTFFTRYRGRGVFLVTAQCAMYCRFCNRRRLVGKGFDPRIYWEETLTYLETHPEIGEVILSGGDPFILESGELAYLLRRLRGMAHIRTIRISSRMPVVFPDRVGAHLDAVGAYGPLWCVVHINHPREITPEFAGVVAALRSQGASVISQTVLLRGINDCPHILSRLFENLAQIGVKPYYLFQLDDVRGATHFKVRLATGLDIMRILRARISGLCLPYYAVDITGGLGKIPLECGYVKGRDGNRVFMENLYGQEGVYLDNGEESRCQGCNICRL